MQLVASSPLRVKNRSSKHIRVALPVAHVCKKDLKTISSRSQMLVQAVSDAPPTSGSLASLAR